MSCPGELWVSTVTVTGHLQRQVWHIAFTLPADALAEYAGSSSIWRARNPSWVAQPYSVGLLSGTVSTMSLGTGVPHNMRAMWVQERLVEESSLSILASLDPTETLDSS